VVGADTETTRVNRLQGGAVTLLMVYMHIQFRLDLQADKSSVVVKGPFFPQVLTQDIESVEQMCEQGVTNQENKV
jgi:hypothetical protein